jgi:transposase-like protein
MAKIKRDSRAVLDTLRNASLSEAAAVELLEKRRWGDSPKCPRKDCASVAVYKMTARSGERERNFRWRCKGCNRMFSVRTATVMEDSRLPLRFWIHAFWSLSASKKGLSALQLQREIGCNYKSALHLAHRIRTAMDDLQGPERPKLKGVVEVDEVYIAADRGPAGKPVGPLGDKQPILGMVERGGALRLTPLPNEIVTAKNLWPIMRRNIDLQARLQTDEARFYKGPGKAFWGGHGVVSHARHQYWTRAGDGTNTVEGAFSILRRSIIGAWHHFSTKHMAKYLSEVAFRYTNRYISDAERMDLAIKGAEGKSLTREDLRAGRVGKASA